uniref:Uncharacterized protein n=1 Tax=Setaria italica TaxID=4555 RepID=K3Z0G8_SETIT
MRRHRRGRRRRCMGVACAGCCRWRRTSQEQVIPVEVMTKISDVRRSCMESTQKSLLT